MVSLMNRALFFANIKKYWKLTVIIILVLFLYASLSVTMYNEDAAASLSELMDTMPDALISALGFDDLGTTLTGFISGFMYGFLIITFPMIYAIVLAYGLCGKMVDSGSMAFLLSTPNSRKRIVWTQIMFLTTALRTVVWSVFLLIVIMSAVIFPGVLDFWIVVKLHLIAYCAVLAVAGVSFLCSCIFNDAKNALGLGAGIPTFFLSMTLLSGASDKIEWVKYLSLYTFLDVKLIMAGGNYFWIALGCLLVINLALYLICAKVFIKKNFFV
jgi:ABC-2 type transport system permease protein